MTGKRYTHRPAVAILFNIIQVGLLVLMPLLTPFLPVTIAEVEARSLQDTNIVAPDGEPAPRPDPVGLQPAPTRGEALQTANVTMVQSVDTGDAGPGNVYNGDWITFTLLITNVESSQPITGVTFVNILEEGAFNESTLHCDPDCEPQWITQTIPEPSGGTVVVSKTESLLWDIGQLASGSSAEVSFSGQVIGQAEGSTLINLASAAYEIEGNQRAVAADDIVLTALLRIPEGGGEATISSAPTWFSEDAGGTISQDWGDFDRDGDLDLVLGSSLGASVYRNDEGTLNLIWASPEGRLAYGVRWANVVTDSSSLELVVVGDSVDKTAQSEGLNYIYAFDAGRTEFIETGVFTSHLQLVRLAPADYDGDGYVDIVASTNAINGREWVGSQQLCPVNLYRNDGTGHFTGTVTSKPGIDVVCVQETATAALGVGDVDGDGDPDLIVGDFPSTVKVLFNSASDPQVGSPFTRAETIERGLEYIPYDLAWGDYDGDGVLEVAAAFPLQREAHVYKYQPDQQSNPRLLLSHIIRTDAFMTPLSVDWGDFNGDGQLDLVVADSPPRFYEYTGQNFEPISSLNLPPSVIRGQIWSLRGIALNTRRNLDLVLGNRDGPSEVFTVLAPRLSQDLHGVGNGEEASSVAWGDADGDGDLDLLFGSAPLPSVRAYVYLNRDGGFVTKKSFKLSSFGPHAVAFGDVDQDGVLEVAVGTPTKLQIYQPRLFQNDYYDRVDWEIDTDSPVRSLAWADANDDSALDLLVGYADGLIELYLNSGTRLSATPVFTATESGAIQSLAWADYDNDYYLDFVVAVDNGRTTIYHNDGDNHYSRAWWTPESALYRAVAWGDYDADGYPDLAIGVYGAPDTVWQNENGRFGSEPVWRSEDLPPNRTTSLAWG
ncbi:MAG: FG-GAP repeat domain-containing protein, partial [Anaerolineales bacterium]